MIIFGNRYKNKILGIFLLVILSLSLKCNKAIVNTPEYEIVYGKMTDIDGNEYKTLKIGNQTWMAENFRCTRYNDGEKINQISEIITWGLDTIGAFCFIIIPQIRILFKHLEHCIIIMQ